MASKLQTMSPICLVENNVGFSVNQKALQILEEISQPVVVVAIVGLYRTGKSYLMNRLAGKNQGFPLGSTVQSETKGIWMWCVPHPSKPDHTLVLLDTEGLGDVEKGDPKNDSWIFALTVLLSSMLIYNNMNTISNDALEKLHYIAELTELIRVKNPLSSSEEEDSIDFVSFFPDFIWTVRDFTLQLKLDGQPITEDKYLENALKLIPDNHPKTEIFNKPRECIRRFFPKRKCFVFDRPTQETEHLANIETTLESQLNPKFLEQSKAFCSYIFTHAKIKTLREGLKVTGNRLATLVVTYVDSINSGDIPCLENAVTTLAQLENSGAMIKAGNHYSEQMSQRVAFPTETLQELLDVHAACEKEAIAVFMKHSFKDENQEFQKNLMEILESKKQSFLLQNKKASIEYCQDILDQISAALLEDISAGTFLVPGGHRLYRESLERIEQKYNKMPRKGVQASKVFQSFLQSQEAKEKEILKVDHALSAAEKAKEQLRMEREAFEKEQAIERQKHLEEQQQMEAKNRSLEENVNQLKEKLEEQKEETSKRINMMLEHNRKVYSDLHNENPEQYKEKSEEEILRKLHKNTESMDDNKILQMIKGLASQVVCSFIYEIVKNGFKKF